MKDYVTREGFKKLKQELQELKTIKRKELAEKLQRAIASGDLSENAEYQEAKEEQAFLEGRIRELEDVIASAKIIEEQRGTIVRIGSTVVVERSDKGHRGERAFTIVGSEEADPTSGKISYVSPLGAGLIGKKAGDKFEIGTPNGPANWKVKGVK